MNKRRISLKKILCRVFIIGFLFIGVSIFDSQCVYAVEKDANDVAVLKELILNINNNSKEKIPTKLNDQNYIWDKETGRLVGINLDMIEANIIVDFTDFTALKSISLELADVSIKIVI